MLVPKASRLSLRSTREAALQSNCVAARAGRVVIARPGSQAWQLVEQILAWGKPLYTLPHHAKEGLVGLEAKVVGMEDIR